MVDRALKKKKKSAPGECSRNGPSVKKSYSTFRYVCVWGGGGGGGGGECVCVCVCVCVCMIVWVGVCGWVGG